MELKYAVYGKTAALIQAAVFFLLFFLLIFLLFFLLILLLVAKRRFNRIDHQMHGL